jgi:hypothetical protein
MNGGAFPVYTSKRPVPTQGKPGPWRMMDFHTAEERGSLASIGQSLYGVGSQWFQKIREKEADAAFYDAVGKDKEAGMQFTHELRQAQELDEEQYDERVQNYLKTRRDNIPTNSKAAQRFNNYLRLTDSSVMQASYKIRDEELEQKLELELYKAELEAIRTENFTKYDTFQNQMVRKYDKDPAKAEEEKRLARRLGARRRLEMMVQSENPAMRAKFLEMYPDPEAMVKKEPHLEPGDWTDINALRKGAELAYKRKQEQREINIDNKAWDMMRQMSEPLKPGEEPKVSHADIVDFIEQNYTGEDRARKLSMYNSILRDLEKGLGSSLVYRKNPEEFWKLKEKAKDLKANESDFREAVNKGHITIRDYDELNNIVERIGKGEGSDIIAAENAMKNMDAAIADNVLTKMDMGFVQSRARQILDDTMKQSIKEGHPLRGYELLKEAKRISDAVIDDYLKTNTVELGPLKEKEWPLNNPMMVEFIERHVQSLLAQGKEKEAKEYYDYWANQ